MAFNKLSSDEKRIVLECMNAIYLSNFIGDFEFQSRLGVSKKELLHIINLYPFLKDDEPNTKIGINNCFNEIAYGIKVPTNKWSLWFSVSQEEIIKAYHKWAKLLGLKSTGIM